MRWRARRERGDDRGGSASAFEVVRVGGGPPSASDSDADGSTRARTQTQRAIAARFFGPVPHGDVVGDANSERSGGEADEERARRLSNCEAFEDLVHLADKQEPVHFDVFRENSSRRRRNTDALSSRGMESQSSRGRKSAMGGEAAAADDVDGGRDSGEYSDSDDDDDLNPRINTELLEAYVAYSKSLGHEPNIQLDSAIRSGDEIGDDDSDRGDHLADPRASYVQRRPVVEEKRHLWTDMIGTRYSRRRGCVQFWAWMLVGVAVVIILGISLSNLELNEVLHLDAFVERDVVVTEDFTYLYLQDEVDFHLKYDLEAAASGANDTHFMVLLMSDDDFENYVDGEEFSYVEKGSTLRTTYASLPLTFIDGVDDEMYLVIQPCVLARNPDADYCQTSKLPTSVRSKQKVFNLGQEKFMTKHTGPNYFPFRYMYINPIAEKCIDSGFQGTAYLLLFIPYLVILFFGLRLVQMISRCESFRANLERAYKKEFNVPENEVDYWQPMPWDRKVPKTRLLGPCCWRKFRRPFEPFYTWWRHENYFTWVFCPYRNERLSRSERAIIVSCSLYITFYVLFIIVMLRDSIGANLSIFTSVVMYAILISILPSAGKAIFKELFKLIFRQRRKYFRTKAAGGDVSQFSFRFAFLLQIFVAVLITATQLPLIFIWLRRSCLFLTKFMYFAALAAVMRLSIMGLVQDFAWYIILKTWGWKDLCPYCTERIVHCDCFNDELLVLAVERVGAKWELIAVLDKVLAKSKGYEPQFALYTADQLRERWEVIVERAENHMEKLEKLRAYREKKRQDRLRRHRQQRRSFVSVTALLGFRDDMKDEEDVNQDRKKPPAHMSMPSTDEDGVHDTDSNSDDDIDSQVCSLREKKILAVNAQIHLEKFEKHYDSTIVDVFRSLAHAVTRHHRPRERERAEDDQSAHYGDRGQTVDEVHIQRGSSHVSRRSSRQLSTKSRASRFDAAAAEEGVFPSGGSDGETMWLFDTPEQRLERREREKLQRKQAFRVLKDYEIETVEMRQDEEGNVEYVAPSTAERAPDSSPAPMTSSAPSLKRGRSILARLDSMRIPLLPRQQRTVAREDDVVVVESDTPELAITVIDDDESDACPSDEEKPPAVLAQEENAGGSVTHPPSPSSPAVVRAPLSRTYSVVPRRQTLLRRVSTSAEAFANWALKYDDENARGY